MILQTFLDRHKLDECAAMDLLQDHGIVSDLCVRASDVADADAAKAIEFLRTQEKPRARK